MLLLLILTLFSSAQNIVQACTLTQQGFTQSQIQSILDQHNIKRNQIAGGISNNGQPTASNMQQMVWSTQLQQMAQSYANTCPMTHNPNIGDAGENIYWSWTSSTGDTTNSDIQNAINDWFNEVSNLNSQNINLFGSQGDSGQTGHYTQLVWANTYEVGCGQSKTKDQGMIKTTLICNYLPAGNYEMESVYIVGQPATRCASKTSTSYKYLCADYVTSLQQEIESSTYNEGAGAETESVQNLM